MQTSTSSLSRSTVFGSKLSSTSAKRNGLDVLNGLAETTRRSPAAVAGALCLLHSRDTAVEDLEALYSRPVKPDLADTALRRMHLRRGAELDMVKDVLRRELVVARENGAKADTALMVGRHKIQPRSRSQHRHLDTRQWFSAMASHRSQIWGSHSRRR